MSRAHVATPAELTALRDLELVVRATVEGIRQGQHRSPFHGYSAEFSQYRHYRPGDDVKHVDWKAFGRTDRLFTRQFRETTNLSALFVVDVSRSMDFAGKFALAQAATATLGTLVIDQGDAAGLLAVGDTATTLLGPRSGHQQIRAFVAAVSRLAPTARVSAAEGLARAGVLLKRRGLVVAVSDFYEDEAALTALRRLARAGHDVLAVQVLAEEERRLEVDGPVELVEAESGRSLVVQPAAVRHDYARRLEAWLAGVEAATRREGIDYLGLITGRPLADELRRFLVRRGRAA